MLVLKRSRNEKITVHTSDGPVQVCVVEILLPSNRHPDAVETVVKVGIDAPESCRIMRSELPQPGDADYYERDSRCNPCLPDQNIG